MMSVSSMSMNWLEEGPLGIMEIGILKMIVEENKASCLAFFASSCSLFSSSSFFLFYSSTTLSSYSFLSSCSIHCCLIVFSKLPLVSFSLPPLFLLRYFKFSFFCSALKFSSSSFFFIFFLLCFAIESSLGQRNTFGQGPRFLGNP